MFAFLDSNQVVGCGLEKHSVFQNVAVDSSIYLDLFNISEHSKYSLVNGVTLVKNTFLRTLGTTIKLEGARQDESTDVCLLLDSKREVTLVLSEKAKLLLKESDLLSIFYIEKTVGYIDAKNKVEELLYKDIYFKFTLPANVNVFVINPFEELNYKIEYYDGTS